MRRLVLVGGGHTHLHVLKQLQTTVLQDVEVVLISPSVYQYYSGMFSGYAEGLYTVDDIRVDVEELCRKARIKWLQDTVVRMDPKRQVVYVRNGESVSYDAVSFDIGSLTAGIAIPGAVGYAHTIKPNYQFVSVMEQVRTADKLVVVGGGAAGIELSLSLQAWRNKQGIQAPVTLVSASRLLSREKQSVSRKIERITVEKGVQLITGETVEAVHERFVVTSTNRELPYDELLWLGGPKASSLFQASHVPVDANGYLLVEDTLQAIGYPSIFGAGDCISFRNHLHIAKAGVYAVRQGPVLFHNLQAFFAGKHMQRYRPQQHVLAILSTGNKQGFLLYKGYSFHGSWAWYFKNQLDTRFVRQYKKYITI